MRVLVTETLDPDGAMHRWCTPDLEALGHEVLPLPTQELAPLLGPDGLAAWLLAVAEHMRPDLVVLCPPYDHVSRETLHRLTALGARPVAFCFDEPLFPVGTTRAAALGAYEHRFVTAPDRVQALPQPASWLRWAASPGAFRVRAKLSTGWSEAIRQAVVLVGRPYHRRVALVRALAERGLPVIVFGHGWDQHPVEPARVGPPLSGPEMHAVLGEAGVVLTTGDWESVEVPMVKYRLLEAAFCGGPQLVQRSPDLESYFEVGREVQAYDGLEDLIVSAEGLLADRSQAMAMAARAAARAKREHTWTVRLGEVVETLGLRGDGHKSGPPPAYLAGLALIAHDAERRGVEALAVEAFSIWDRLAPSATAAAGLARLTQAPEHSARALAHLARDPRPTAGLYSRLPTQVGTGLGQVGYLDPSPELLAMRLTALLAQPSAERVAAASDLVEALVGDPDLLVATAALLVPEEEEAAVPVWKHLFAAALWARPQHHDFSEHHARWRAAVDSLR